VPNAEQIPILLSIPHCGTAFPDDIRDQYVQELIEAPDDTDWFVDQLYSFAPSMGITVLSAVWSRWVIDLNRHPASKPLYSDGRIITDLCPLTTFLGQSLYKDGRRRISDEEVARRTVLYFDPYHTKLQELLADMRARFGVVLLWDCHSIRQVVPTIQSDKFPDLILGSADGKSAHARLIETALESLRKGRYSVQHNDPFKGGFITRQYGIPHDHQHALQLEMSKINYLDDTETRFHPERAKKMGELLYNTLSSLSGALISIKD
jgi:N-formylglutamate deformylase